MRRDDIAVWEINEAFSSVAITSSRRLGLEDGLVNQYGGAVAMGHPIGASGARIIGTVINQLRKRGGGYGIAAICRAAAKATLCWSRSDSAHQRESGARILT